MEGAFYCILAINKNTGKRGYVIETPMGIAVSDDFVAACKNFATYQEAQEFISSKKIERRGITAYIRDNNDIIKENKDKLIKAPKDVYFITKGDGEYIHYSANEYYFRKGKVGACCWYNYEEVKKAIEAVRPNFIGDILTEEKLIN